MERIVTFLILSVLLHEVIPSEEDWVNCTPCRCTWSSGKKAADCKKSPTVVLNSIPTNLSSEIRHIDLSDQNIYHLPGDVFKSANLADLQKIKLTNCHLTEIDKNAFRDMLLMIELDMSNNSITYLHPNTFQTNTRLRVLDLKYNNIEKLDNGLFANLNFLQKVELDHNKIHTIGLTAFANNTRLQLIHLDNNQLINLSKEFMEKWEKVNYLSLHENPWKCDCHLKDFRDFAFKKNLLTHPSFTKCFKPERLKQRLWTELQSQDFACRPIIITPPNSQTIINAESKNVTLYCKVSGDPKPDVNWAFKNYIIDTTPRRPGAQRYLFQEIAVSDSVSWYNLTILGITSHDNGMYK